MKKTYFEAPALELVKVQSSMQMMAGSGPTVDDGGEGDEAGSRGFSGFGLEDDTEEEE